MQRTPASPEITQGLDWYKAKLKQDRDGDVADEFLLERSDKSTKGPDKGLKVQLCWLLFPHICHSEHGVFCAVQPQKRHLKQPADSNVLVEGGNVYVVPNA